MLSPRAARVCARLRVSTHRDLLVRRTSMTAERLSAVRTMVGVRVCYLLFLWLGTFAWCTRADVDLGGPAPESGVPAPKFVPAPDPIVVDTPAPESTESVVFIPAPSFYSEAQFEQTYASGTTACVQSALLEAKCALATPCELEDCRSYCEQSESCLFLTFNVNGACSLYSSCATRTVTVMTEVWKKTGVQVFNNFGEEVTLPPVYVPEAAFVAIFASSATTCGLDYKLSQPCSSALPCSQEQCGVLCAADDACWFIYSLPTGGCFLYSDCVITRTASAIGNTLVKGVTSACDGIIVDYDAIALANAPSIDSSFELVYLASTTTCETAAKLEQPCSTATPCSDEDCVGYCANSAACNFALSVNPDANGGCILYSSCHVTRTATTTGNTYGRIQSRRYLAARERLTAILRELSEDSWACPPKPILSKVAVYNLMATTCDTSLKVSQPCTSAAPCSTDACFQKCLDEATCTFFLHVGQVDVTGGCMLYSGCDTVRTASTLGSTYEVVETYPIETTDAASALTPPDCEYDKYCVHEDLFNTRTTCSNKELNRVCSNGNPCSAEECTRECDIDDECEFVRHSVLGACLLFSQCDIGIKLVFKGTTYVRPRGVTTEEPTTTTTTSTATTVTTAGSIPCLESWTMWGECSSSCVGGTQSRTFFLVDTSIVPCSADHTSYVGDGFCDSVAEGYNTRACDWDGGDCCRQTCTNGPFFCGSNTAYASGYFCKDPNDDSVLLCSYDGSLSVGDVGSQQCNTHAPCSTTTRGPTTTTSVIACVGTWGAWGSCSSTCGSRAIKLRTFVVSVAAANGGTVCSVDNGATQPMSCGLGACVGPTTTASTTTTTTTEPITTTTTTVTTTTTPRQLDMYESPSLSCKDHCNAAVYRTMAGVVESYVWSSRRPRVRCRMFFACDSCCERTHLCCELCSRSCSYRLFLRSGVHATTSAAPLATAVSPTTSTVLALAQSDNTEPTVVTTTVVNAHPATTGSTLRASTTYPTAEQTVSASS